MTTELIVCILLAWVVISIPLGTITALTIGFTPRDVYESTHMNMPFCWVLYILVHIVFFATYLIIDVYLLAHIGRNK